ncbi:MAG: transcription termination/antitermination protein NusG [Flaviflexus sp.]|nr:transcription termination/antitermination protein NusG [Flaviflexus sp.]
MSSDQVPEAAAAEQAEDPTSPEAIRKRLRGLPGKWYVLHTYAGYEKRVKQNLEIRMKTMNMEEYIFQVEVPMEEVFEVKGGQRKLVTRVRMPGYALVRMIMEDDAWRIVQETQGVTGFVGNGRTPVALTEPEVIKMLTPVVEAEQAAAARKQGKPTGTDTPVIAVEYEVGENVTLTAEPWVGMPATISAIDAANQRLTVLMTLVGQETPVDLSFSQVKKAD